MTKRRIKLIVAYDGTDYCGWQIQPNGLTIQEVLNRACSGLTGETVMTLGASRTDAGVHASGQVAVFDTDSSIPASKFALALNARLPRDIRVLESCQTEGGKNGFHPRFTETVKTYEYHIWNAPVENPICSRYCAHVYGTLDTESMRKAAAYLVGEHDFQCFQASGSDDVRRSTIRRIYSAELIEKEGDPELIFRITGNGFLYHMVRIIAGTLIEIARGRRRAEDMQEILASKSREAAGATAPARGLILKKIDYPDWK